MSRLVNPFVSHFVSLFVSIFKTHIWQLRDHVGRWCFAWKLYVKPANEGNLKKEDSLKNDDDLKNGDNLKNDDDLKNEENNPSRLSLGSMLPQYMAWFIRSFVKFVCYVRLCVQKN